MQRIAFIPRVSDHRHILEPVHGHLADDLPCLVTHDVHAALGFSPRIVLVADAEYFPVIRSALPETVIVWLRHGFSSKNYLAGSVAGCDFACVTSEWTMADLRARGILPQLGFWLTGFVPMDPILQGHAAVPEEVRARLGPGPTLLYTPTYDRALSSAELLGDGWIESLRRHHPSLNVIIKPHPAIPDIRPEWMAMWRQMLGRDGVILVEDVTQNVYALFPIADVLLTDASSVMFYYLAMDRPIILMSNPQRFGDRHFDPDGPEWTWRDMGIEIDHVAHLPAAVLQALNNPADRGAKRAFYRERVFGTLEDGRAAERVADRVRSLLQPAEGDRLWVDLAWQSMATTGRLRREATDLKRRFGQTLDQRARRVARVALRKLLPGWRRRDRG